MGCRVKRDIQYRTSRATALARASKRLRRLSQPLESWTAVCDPAAHLFTFSPKDERDGQTPSTPYTSTQ
jgi:hypothetical protein